MEVLRVERVVDRGVVLADIEGVEEAVQVLHVRDIAAETYHNLIVELAQALYIGEACKRAVRCYNEILAHIFHKSLLRNQAVPRLSAAITTPSLNLAARTEVPVTIGPCEC